MGRWILLAVAALAIVIFGFSLIDTTTRGDVQASAVLAAPPPDSAGFTRAVEPRAWQFPQDHGAHPDFQTEWWYYTGNLADADGRRFGFQFTIFRRALTPESTVSDSEWRSNQVYLAHFTVSDVEGDRFYHAERLSRAGAAVAGATDAAAPSAAPSYRVWVEDWHTVGLNADACDHHIRADAGDFAVDFSLMQTKPPALQGENGLSHKSGEAGNASYYYSLSRLATEGTIRIGGETFTVGGNTWMDHEFSTSALGSTALGWDWFGLIFDDGRELMLGQIRLADGGREPAFGGLLVNPDGTTTYLPSSAFTIESTGSWTSPHTGATYPAGWTITVAEAEPFTFTLTPLLADQELQADVASYWEGAVRIDGDATGYGYAELTGYVNAMTGRF